MANYTMTIQEIIDSGINIFDFSYTLTPFMDRAEIEKRFIDRYYFREIGYETYSMWKHRLEREWKNKIRIYNKLFDVDTELEKLDPVVKGTTIYSEVISRMGKIDETGNTTGNSSSTGDVEEKVKDTPISEFDSSNYVSGITTGTSNNNQDSIVDSIRNILNDIKEDKSFDSVEMGNIDDVVRFYNKYIDVVERFINEFAGLFMGIY